MSPKKSTGNPAKAPVDELSYEQALAELETIVSTLETNKLSLDESMALYERGKALTRHCLTLLDNAELRVKKLSGDTLVDLADKE